MNVEERIEAMKAELKCIDEHISTLRDLKEGMPDEVNADLSIICIPSGSLAKGGLGAQAKTLTLSAVNLVREAAATYAESLGTGVTRQSFIAGKQFLHEWHGHHEACHHHQCKKEY